HLVGDRDRRARGGHVRLPVRRTRTAEQDHTLRTRAVSDDAGYRRAVGRARRDVGIARGRRVRGPRPPRGSIGRGSAGMAAGALRGRGARRGGGGRRVTSAWCALTRPTLHPETILAVEKCSRPAPYASDARLRTRAVAAGCRVRPTRPHGARAHGVAEQHHSPGLRRDALEDTWPATPSGRPPNTRKPRSTRNAANCSPGWSRTSRSPLARGVENRKTIPHSTMRSRRRNVTRFLPTTSSARAGVAPERKRAAPTGRRSTTRATPRTEWPC